MNDEDLNEDQLTREAKFPAVSDRELNWDSKFRKEITAMIMHQDQKVSFHRLTLIV